MATHKCAVHAIQNLLGKRWTLFILEELEAKSAANYNRLKAKLPSVTAKVLSQRLSELTHEKIIVRKVLQKSPLHVEYQLSAKGKDLMHVLKKMKDWGISYNLVPANCTSMNCNDCRPVSSPR